VLVGVASGEVADRWKKAQLPAARAVSLDTATRARRRDDV
jgi:hypothetical protein